MGRIIFDLLIILGNIWVISSKHSTKLSKRLSLLAIILLTISVTIQVLEVIGIV